MDDVVDGTLPSTEVINKSTDSRYYDPKTRELNGDIYHKSNSCVKVGIHYEYESI